MIEINNYKIFINKILKNNQIIRKFKKYNLIFKIVISSLENYF